MIFSYSSISTYKQCPAKFNYAYVEKVEVPPGPPSPAMERGSKIHESVDAYLQGTTEFLHPDIHSSYGQFMMGLRSSEKDLRPEFKWGITWDFKPCDYDAPDCMIHGYIDLLIVPEDEAKVLPLYEWKTGGIYPDQHTDQIWTYATVLMCHFPERPGVDGILTYFDKNDYKKVHYPSSMMFEYKPMMRNRISQIVDETRYPAFPSFKCKWCQFSKYNGGPCRF